MLPILILFTTWADSRDADRLADALNLPEETRSVLEEAIQGAGLASFCFLATAVLGQVISTDRGRLSQWIQGTEPAKEIKEDSDGT